MAANSPVKTILCAQCSRHAQRQPEGPLPEGWAEHFGQLSCSEECRELMRTMGLIPEE